MMRLGWARDDARAAAAGLCVMESQGSYAALEDRVSAAIAAADPSLFDSLALEVFDFQRASNRAYGAYCRQLGLPNSLGNWRQIPALPQSAFKLAPLWAFPADATAATFRTSGTTGEGYGEHHFCSLRLYDDAILRGWDLLKLPLLPQILLIPPPSAASHSSLSHMMGTLKERALRGEQHWCFTNGTLDLAGLWRLLEGFQKNSQPVLLLGTALSYLHWFESDPQSTFHLPPSSLAFETGGYKGSGRSLSKPELYEMFHQRLGLDASHIINEYGMTELSSQCYTRGLGQPHVAPPWARAIAVNPGSGREVDDGETGVLRIYDLANLGSVMAVQTRDLAIRHSGDFELLGRDPAALPRGCSRAADEMLAPSAP